MPAPSTSLATYRPDIAGSFQEFELSMASAGFVAAQVFPVMEVAREIGTFGKIPIEQLLANRDTERAPGSGYARSTFKFTTDTYACIEHGAEEVVDDRAARIYADYFDAEMVAAARANDVVNRNAERRVADLLFNATTFSGLTAGVTNEWDDFVNATPIADVLTATKNVHNNSGLWPNAMVITREVFLNLRQCDEIVDRVKYQNAMDVRPGNITSAALSNVFDLEVIVAGGDYNSANEGQSASLSPVWSKEYALIFRKPTRGNDIQEPCLGRMFHYAGDGSELMGRFESYRDESVRGDVIRVRHDVDEKLLYASAGYLLSNITT